MPNMSYIPTEQKPRVLTSRSSCGKKYTQKFNEQCMTVMVVKRGCEGNKLGQFFVHFLTACDKGIRDNVVVGEIFVSLF